MAHSVRSDEDAANVAQLQQSQDALSKMDYISRNKLFVLINYQILKELVAASNINSFAKILFLSLYVKAYKACINKHGKLKDAIETIFDYKSLAEEHSYSRSL